MKTLACTALILTLAGCASAPLQQAPPAHSETYQLIAVDNVAPPVFLTEGLLAGSEVVGGDLTLNADNTFRMRLDMRTQMSSLKPFEYRRNFDGTYQATTIGVTMTWQDGSMTSSAFFGRTLRLYRGGVEYLFVK